MPRCKGGEEVLWCRGGCAELVQRWSRPGGAEGWFRVIVQRWCRRSGAEVVQRCCRVIVQWWCRGFGEEVQEGAEVLQVQRWCRCRGGTGVVQCTCGVGWCGGASAGAEVVWRWTGAEVNWCSRGCEEEKVQRY